MAMYIAHSQCHKRSQGGKGLDPPHNQNVTNDNSVTKKSIVSSVSFDIFRLQQ